MPAHSESRPVRVAFIGAGHFANLFHYATLSRMEDVEIVAVAELDTARMTETADKYGIAGRYSDYRKMIEQENPDAVYVIMRPDVVQPLALEVLRLGKPVMTEKPAAMDTASVRELAEAAATAGVVSQVGTNRRYCAVIRKAKELVTERGPVSTCLAEFHKDLKREMFGMSNLYADGLHALDALRFFGGEVAEVHAHADHWFTKEEWPNSNNVYQALLRFEGGASGLYTANRQGGARYERFEIHGDGISCYIRAPEMMEVWRTGEKEPEIITGMDLTGSDDQLDTYGYFDENRAFIDAVRSGVNPENHFGSNLRLMELCDAIENGAHREVLRG